MPSPPDLANYTTLGLGGPAREIVCAHDEATLIDAVRTADAGGVPVLLLGGGSNLVVADAGFEGRVVRILTRGVTMTPAGDRVRVCARAGEPWDELVARCVEARLAGLECLSGIPGLVGATPVQNVGAYGQEVRETIATVRAWDRHAREVVDVANARCGFRYRDSVFKHEERGRYVVLAVTFVLVPGGAARTRYAELERALARRPVTHPDRPPSLQEVRDAVLALRRTKSMVLDPADPESRSVGSFFVNPIVPVLVAEALEARARATGLLGATETLPRYPTEDGRAKLSAAWLIERAGFPRGTTRGPVAVSTRHALALVHHGGGSAHELVALARGIRRAVRAVFGVALTPEPVFAGFGSDDPTDVSPDDPAEDPLGA